MPTMKNGNLCQTVKRKGKIIIVHNACTFDACSSPYFHPYDGMNSAYKRIVQTTDNCFLQLATKVANQGKISKNEARASFLTSSSLFQETKYDTISFAGYNVQCCPSSGIHIPNLI